MNKNPKNIVGLLIVVVLVLVAYSYFNKPKTPSAENPITIGAVLPLSGAAASFGEYAKKGMDLAVNEINTKGGIDGRAVKIIYEDDQTDSKNAVSAFTKLTSIDKVQGVIGGLWDFLAQPIMPLALDKKIPFISPSNFRIEGGFELNDQSFVLMTDFNKVIRQLTSYLKQDKVKKIAVVHFSSTYGTEIGKTINEISIEIGKGKIINESYSDFGSADFKTTVAKLKQANIDTVFLDMVDVDTVNFLTRAKELGFKATFITYVGAYDAFKPENMNLLEGLIVLNWEASNPDFIKNYQAAYGQNPAKSANRAYDSVYVMAEALAKSSDPASYIASHSFKTVNGKIEFLPTHQVSTTDVEIDVYQGGELVPYRF